MPARVEAVPAPIQAVPPPAAPHAMVEDPVEAAMNAKLQGKAEALRAAPSAVPYSDVTIIMGVKTKQGRQEVIHDIGPGFRILDCTHNVKEKVRAVTEEGMYLGVEPTGEYEMTIKVKYLKL